MFDDQIKIVHTSQGIKHINTAGIIRHNDMLLLVEQNQSRHLLELPVSHVFKNESLEHALERTIRDILGIEVTATSLLTQIKQPASICPYGADSEEWAIFDVTVDQSELVACSPTRQILWLPIDSIDTKRVTVETDWALHCLGYRTANRRQGPRP